MVLFYTLIENNHLFIITMYYFRYILEVVIIEFEEKMFES
jgi:hypothetical protein